MDKILSFSNSNDIFNYIKFIDSYSDNEIINNLPLMIFNMKRLFLYSKLEEYIKISIKNIKDINLKSEQIKKYFYNFYKYDWENIFSIIENHSLKEKECILRNLNNLKFSRVQNILNIPSNLNFGLELEYSNVSLKFLKKLWTNNSIIGLMNILDIPKDIQNSIIKNTVFEKEGEFDKFNISIENDIDTDSELSTPIMNNSLKNLNEIKAFILLFKFLNAELNGSTSLQINIDVKYLQKNIKALNYLLTIWGECEELFFKIAGPENEVIRNSTLTMAKPIKHNIQNFFNNNSNFEINDNDDMNLFLYNVQGKEYLEQILEYTHDSLLNSIKTKDDKIIVFNKFMKEDINNKNDIKYTSINFNHMEWNKNIGRIEFRIFNNSLSSDIIFQDLTLIAKLCETCVLLASNPFYKKEIYVALLNHNISEENKLNLLLDLLFDDDYDKNVFKKRWNSVKDLEFYQYFKVGVDTFCTSPNNKQLIKSLSTTNS